MIEVSRKFPTPAVLDRIAGALNIKTYQLFAVPPSPEDALEMLRQDIVGEIEEIVVKAINQPRRRADGVWLVREEIYSTGGLLPRHHRQRIEPPQRLPRRKAGSWVLNPHRIKEALAGEQGKVKN
jgi:hypothetical protein